MVTDPLLVIFRKYVYFFYLGRTTHAALCQTVCKRLAHSACPLYQPFTVREMEYLEMIRLKDLDLYKKIVGRVVPRERNGHIMGKKLP